MAAYRNRMQQHWESMPPMFNTSAEKRIGKEEVLEYLEFILDQQTD
jgi:GTP-binding protein